MANIISSVDGILNVYDDGTIDIVGGTLHVDGTEVLGGANEATFTGLIVDSPTLVVDAVNHRVGIGTNAPTQKLEVIGQIFSTGAIGNLNNNGSGTGQQLENGTSALSTLRFDSDAWRIYAGGAGSAGELFRITETGAANFVSDVTVGGNLIVNGTTTSVNTETITLADNIIVLNSNEAGTPSQNAGIEVERGTSTNVVLQWNETNDYWEVASGGTVGRILTTGDDGTGNGLNADKVDGLHASSFLRSDANDTASGSLTFGGVTTFLSTDDEKIVLRVPPGDTTEWNYIAFKGSDATRDAYVGTNNTGELQLYSDLYGNYLASQSDRWFTNENFNVGGSTITGGTAASDTTNLALDVQGDAAIRGTNRLYWGVTTDNYNSWKTAQWQDGSTHTFAASEFVFNNAGYSPSLEYMRIKATTGDIGIGTNAPATRLHVYKNANRNTITLQNNNHIAGFDAFGTATTIYTNASNGFFFRQGAAGTYNNIMHVDSTGYVGIDVDNPTNSLNVGNTSTLDHIKLRSLTTGEGQQAEGTGISWTWDSSSTWTQEWAAIRAILPGNGNTHLTFSTKDTGITMAERMRIQDDGKIGIGTTNPGEILTVNGNMLVYGGGHNGAGGGPGTLFLGTGPNSRDWGFRRDVTNRDLNIDSYTGSSWLTALTIDRGTLDVGIGTTAPTVKLDVRGDVLSYQNGFYVEMNSNGANDRAGMEFISTGHLGIVADAQISFRESDVAAVRATFDVNNNTFRFGDGAGPSTNETLQVAGTALVTSSLAVNDYVSAGAQKLSMGILDIATGGTPTQIKIITNIPFASGTADFTVNIKGFQYGSAGNADLSIHWHYYNSTFYSANVRSTGYWNPTVTLGVENSKVVIHLTAPGYWPKMYVESMYSSSYTDQYASGWTWTDAAISSDANTPQVTPDYKVGFGNGIRFDATSARFGAPVLINGADDNTGKADFAVETNAVPTISWRNNQIQIGGDDMNFSTRIYDNGNTFIDSWDRHQYIRSIGGTTSRNIYFQPSNAGTAEHRMTILGSNGNVGIGTSNPSSKLHILENTAPGTTQWDYKTTANFQAAIGNQSHLEIMQIRDGTTNNTWFETGTRIQQRIDSSYMGYMQFNGTGNTWGISWGTSGGSAGPEAAAERMRLTQGGYLGLGTTGPSASLHVESPSDDGSGVRISRAGNTSYMQLYPAYSGVPTIIGSSGGLHMGYNSNTNGIRIDTSNNVGIGITDPGYKLDVQGGSAVAARFETTADYQITLQSDNSWTGIWFDDSGGTADPIWHNGTYGTFAMGGGGSNVSGKKLHVHGGMTIGSGLAATRPTINGLTVEGAIRAPSGVYGSSFGLEDTGFDCYINITDANPTWLNKTYGGEFYFYGDKSTSSSLLYAGGLQLYNDLDVNGKSVLGGGGGSSRSNTGVTITTNITSTYSVDSDSGDPDRQLSIVNENAGTNTYTGLSFRSSPSSNTSMFDMKFVNTGSGFSDLHYVFRDGANGWKDRVTFKSNGNVGIGTNNPGNKFEVYGTAGQLFSVTDSLSGTIFSVNDSSGIPSIEVEDSGQVRFAEFTGNVLIGTSTDDLTNKLQVTGGIMATGDVTAYSSSDERLKTNLQPISDAMSKVNSLTGYTFNWNDDAFGKDKTVREVGVIAQDVEKVLPEVTTTRDDGFMAVKYEKMTPLLIEAMKEQQAMINELKAEIEDLKKR